jgi:hypothetical protein
MNILCFRPLHNTPGKRDVTGAFAPEAEKFLKVHGGGVVHAFNNQKPMAHRRQQVLEIIKAEGKDENFDAVAFFCHGWSTGIQAGFMRPHIQALATAIDTATGATRDLGVVLYCCSTGDDPQDQPDEAAGTGDNSFADRLRDALCATGDGNEFCRVTAHSTVAHATQNPYVLFFDGMGSKVGGVGGYFPVGPGSPLWPKWRKKLRETDLRFRFPFLSVEELHKELLSPSK